MGVGGYSKGMGVCALIGHGFRWLGRTSPARALYSLEVPTPFLISISGVSRHHLPGTDLALIPPILWVLSERNAPYNTSETRPPLALLSKSPANRAQIRILTRLCYNPPRYLLDNRPVVYAPDCLLGGLGKGTSSASRVVVGCMRDISPYCK